MSSTEGNSKLKVYIKTFGCQMNKADSRRLEEIFVSKGYETADVIWDADVIIFNTCSVREHAEQKAMSHIGRLKFIKDKKPDISICIVGCMAQRMQKSIIDSQSHVDLVVGPSTMFDIPEMLTKKLSGSFPDTEDKVKVFYDVLPDIVDKTRHYSGYVPIMKGCCNYCTYCIVPYVRGKEQYRPVDDIIRECSALSDAGVREIMLLGQSVNSHPDFKKILKGTAGINGIQRVRFVTSYPGKLDRGLVDTVAEEPVLSDYFHIPVQSGSDKVLQRMNRKYSIKDFLENVMYIREKIPGAAISSDFIVGFPGETEDDFKMTLDVVKQVEFDQSFTFKYSPRPGTEAADFDDDVALEEKKERLQHLNELCTETALKRNSLHIGEIVEIFPEGPANGRTGNYKIVYWEGAAAEPDETVRVRITDALAHSLKGDRT
ncbi:MAG: tRNA (N6-isopentenyl adenosine(37)-C2)-methylthiotransferase MiaB [Elusimicrobiota bacterium]